MNEEYNGGKIKNLSKAFTKGLSKFSTTINPMNHIIDNKNARSGMISTGNATHDYILPSVVSIGKPVLDSTAAASSTLLTGNPFIGKTVSDTLWNNMVANNGYDPQQNQKSKMLGSVSSIVGQQAGQVMGATIGGNILVIGGKIDENTIRQIVHKKMDNKKKNSINDYDMDVKLSGKRTQVYHNVAKNKTIINHQGVPDLQKWATDLKLGLLHNKSGPRYNHVKKMTQKAEEKYQHSKIIHIGHHN